MEELNSRILRLPREGRLLVCTDLHGNHDDFCRMRSIFQQNLERGTNTCLLFTGDLVHGPNYSAFEWPEFLGAFYDDRSAEVVEEFIELKRTYPDQVFCLLGNHEHSHIGGPHTPKFWHDETAHFERTVGSARTARYRQLFASFPLLAVTHCGVAISHAAPNLRIESADQLEALAYEGYEAMRLERIEDMPPLGRLLWSRRCPPPVVRAFLEVLGRDCRLPLHVVVYGHDVVTDGAVRFGLEQLVLSSSFGLKRANKCYLDIDLAGEYRSVTEFMDGRELRRLYP